MSDPSLSTQLTKRQRFMNAVTGKPIDRPPVWLMRQAGRYMPEYRAVKEKYTFHEMCRIPEVAAEVTLQPLQVLDIDALIIFNDILIPLEAMGYSVEFREGGPEVIPAFRNERDLERLKAARFDETPAVYDSISLLRKQAGKELPILGFAGSPFTMATYLIEGKMSRNMRYIKEMLYANPTLLEKALERIASTVVEYLKAQIQAGADAVQIFDSWAGTLSVEEYRRFALPWQKQVIREIQSNGTPVILYVNNSAHVIPEMKESGALVLSVDWRLNLETVAMMVGPEVTLQGNLDPTALYAPPETVTELTREMLKSAGRTTRYIANLGHGILVETPVESVKAFVEAVKNYDYENL